MWRQLYGLVTYNFGTVLTRRWILDQAIWTLGHRSAASESMLSASGPGGCCVLKLLSIVAC